MENYKPGALMQAIAHEIRTPLGIVVGYFELLNGGHDFPVSEREAIIRRMREAVGRINTVLKQMEAGELTLQLSDGTPPKDDLHVRGTDAQEARRAQQREEQ